MLEMDKYGVEERRMLQQELELAKLRKGKSVLDRKGMVREIKGTQKSKKKEKQKKEVPRQTKKKEEEEEFEIKDFFGRTIRKVKRSSNL